MSYGLAGLKALSLMQEFCLALLAEHAIGLEHLTHSFLRRRLDPPALNAATTSLACCRGADHQHEADSARRADAGRSPVEPSVHTYDDRRGRLTLQR